MTASRVNTYRALTFIFLVIVIVVGGISIWSKYHGRQQIEITMPPEPEIAGRVDISGAVNNPGIYPLKGGDSLGDLIQAAGGKTGDAHGAARDKRNPGESNCRLSQPERAVSPYEGANRGGWYRPRYLRADSRPDYGS